MDVFGPVSDRLHENNSNNATQKSLLGLMPELAIPGRYIVDKLQSVSVDEVAEIVERHLWVKFYSDSTASADRNLMTEEQRNDALAAMGIKFDRQAGRRRIDQSILTGEWDKLIKIFSSKLSRQHPTKDQNGQKFVESKEDWYTRYCHRQTVITYEYAKLVSSRIINQGWTDVAISPAEFIFIAKPLSEMAANKAGYFKASNAAKSSIPILGTVVSDNWYAAHVKQLFLAPYLEEYHRLEKICGKRLF
jgi:hypothetical protein